MVGKILVTGGAGYIGSAAVNELIQKNYSVVVVDNLSTGIEKLVHRDALFYNVDLVDCKKLNKIFAMHNFDSVMHFASYKSVEESMVNPKKYCENITGTINLLNSMAENSVKKIIFSSSATVYGVPDYLPVDEKHPLKPTNFYGYTKLKCEELIGWFSKIYKMSHVNLRYFNVAGDCGIGYVDPDAKNIFPVLMEVLIGKRRGFEIFGKNYSTPDGTCVRDYIGINDLIKAHIAALKLNKSEIINLGTSKGISVKELVEKTIKITGKKFKYKYVKKREGDSPQVVASFDKAKKLLNWIPKESVGEMIKTTCAAYNKEVL